MITLNKENNNDIIIVTLEDMKVYNNSTYRFTFTNITTKNIVTFDVSAVADLSNYKDRCNKFSIDTSTVFANEAAGQWNYEVLEVESDKILEYGKMTLKAPAQVEYVGYELEIKYK